MLKSKIKFAFDTNKSLFNKLETYMQERIREAPKSVTIPNEQLQLFTQNFYKIKDYEQQLQQREEQVLEIKT